MKKTNLSLTLWSLMLLLMVMLVPQRAWALGGSGTSSSPYTIANASDLVAFANKVNGSEQGAYAKLTADITLTSAWTAMGTSSKPYTGTFDGNGKTISGMSMTYTTVNAGFFGYVKDATIKNFTLNGTMTSSTQITSGENDCSGAVVGRAMGSSTIQDIVSNVNITLTKAQKHLGGVVGAIEGSTVVKGCTYTGTLDAGPSTDCIGGIVGFAPASCSGSIFYCFFKGKLSSSSSTPTMGGILGYTNDESNNFSGVHDCYSCGTFSFGTSDYKYVNAIVGRIRNRATTTINNAYLSGIATRACNTDGPSIPASNKAITISVTAGANGTVSQTYVNPTTSAATQLQVVATPSAHYHFGSWSDSKAQTHNVGLTANVSLTASFAIDQHTITVATNNANYGTVSGGGTFDYNSTKTITATPKTHYHLKQWNDGNTSTSRQITVTEDKTYTATFAIDQHTITVKTNDSSMGTVSGGGTFDYNSTKTITATPKAHYHFVQWNDGVKTASRQISVTGNATYTATFEIDQHTITLKTNDSNMGTVSGGGTFDYGTQNVSITATPKEHYHFVEWNDGNKNASRSITVTGNATYTATFAIDQHTITLMANNDNMGTVSGGGTFDYGTEQTITATPNAGCYFVKWNDGNTDNPRTITVSEDMDYTAYFDKPQALLDTQNMILTFYCDAESHEGSDRRFFQLNAGAKTPGWFNRASDITSVVFDESFKIVHPTSCYSWFQNFVNLSEIKGLEYLNTDSVSNMSYMFNNCKLLKSLDLSHFNTEKVTDMSYMFSDCLALTSLDLSSFCPKKVEDMVFMFSNCIALTSLKLKSFDTSSVKTMAHMFDNCQALEFLDLSGFNTSSVEYLSSMFSKCLSLKSINLSNFNTSKVKQMEMMFLNCSSLSSLDLSSFNTSNVTNVGQMFKNCSSLRSLDLSSFDTSGVKYFQGLFSGCSDLEELIIDKYDMQKRLVYYIHSMFDGCTKLNTLTMKSVPFLEDGSFNTHFSGDGKTVKYMLDDNSVIYTGTNNLPAPATSTATFNREIVADGGMYSFIVPFDIPAGQAAELGKFYQYSGHDPEVRKVYFDDIAEVSDGVVKANTAYFFKPARDITSFTVNNPNIPRTLTIRDPENPSVPGLYGTYREIEVPEGAYGYAMQGEESTFVRAGFGNVLRPYRAYLWLGSGAYMAKASAIFGDYDVDAIELIGADDLDLNAPIYNLQGQRIVTPKKGEIYIQNGKKVIKK